MAHVTLGPNGLTGRTFTHRQKTMTLWVTRQSQDFVNSGDLQLADLELINASVELVGEPGLSNNGNISVQHQATFNSLHAVNEQGVTSIVRNIQSQNRIETKAHLNHAHVDVEILGMTQGHHFRQDEAHLDNRLHLTIPTDLGLMEGRFKSWPPTPIPLEAVKLEQQIRVNTLFLGNGGIQNRVARFVEDWADSPTVQAAVTSRNNDGTVRYFASDDETQAGAVQCQVPANCITAMKLVFLVKPRTTL